MTDTKKVLLLDAAGKAVSCIMVDAAVSALIGADVPEGYTGVFFEGAQWDGKKLIDPNPAPVVTEAEVVPSLDGGPDVVA